MYVCIYVCVYVCMHVCMYVCMCVCIYVCMMYLCMYVCMYVRVHACMRACMYECMYLCMYECVFICSCVYVSVCLWSQTTNKWYFLFLLRNIISLVLDCMQTILIRKLWPCFHARRYQNSDKLTSWLTNAYVVNPSKEISDYGTLSIIASENYLVVIDSLKPWSVILYFISTTVTQCWNAIRIVFGMWEMQISDCIFFLFCRSFSLIATIFPSPNPWCCWVRFPQTGCLKGWSV